MYPLHRLKLNMLSIHINKFPTNIRLCHATKQNRVILLGSEAYVYKKFIQLNAWYTRIIGLDEVKKHQDRVIELQEKLMKAQEVRRQIAAELTDVRLKSNELQDRINKTRRSDDLQGYLDLMRDETDVLRLEKTLTEKLSVSDREERDLLAAFTNAIRDSHEKQRAQIEYTKYFGIVLSIVGSFLAFLFARIRNYDIKCIISESIERTLKEKQVVNQNVGGVVGVGVNNAELMNKFSISLEKYLGEKSKHLNDLQSSNLVLNNKHIDSLMKFNKTFESKLSDVALNVEKFNNKLNNIEIGFNKQQKSILISNEEIKKAIKLKRSSDNNSLIDNVPDEQTIGKIVLGTLGLGLIYVLFFRN